MDAKVSRLAIGLGILMALSQWSSAQLAQTGGPGGGSVQCFAGNGSSIFAGTWNGGLFQSSASGTPGWAAITSGLPADSWIYSLADTGATMIAGTNTGVYISKNSGTSWAVADTGQLNTGVLSLAVQETGYQMNIFAGTDGHGVYYSSDTGKSWDKVSMDSLTIDSTRIFSLLFNGTILFAAGDSGVYRSSDSIPDWTAVNTGLSSGTSVRSLAMSGSNLYAGTIGGGVYYSSTNVTPSWTQQNSGLSNLNVQSLVVGGSDLRRNQWWRSVSILNFRRSKLDCGQYGSPGWCSRRNFSLVLWILSLCRDAKWRNLSDFHRHDKLDGGQFRAGKYLRTVSCNQRIVCLCRAGLRRRCRQLNK